MEVSQGSTTCKSQDGEDPKHDGQEEELQQKLQASDVRSCPDVRRVPGHGRPDKKKSLRTSDVFRTFDS